MQTTGYTVQAQGAQGDVCFLVRSLTHSLACTRSHTRSLAPWQIYTVLRYFAARNFHRPSCTSAIRCQAAAMCWVGLQPWTESSEQTRPCALPSTKVVKTSSDTWFLKNALGMHKLGRTSKSMAGACKEGPMCIWGRKGGAVGGQGGKGGIGQGK